MNTIKIAIPILAGLSISLAHAAPPSSGVNTIGQLNCLAGEVAMFDGASWICADVTADLQGSLDALASRVSTLESENQALKDRLACVTSSSNANEFIFEGCNVHVRNGAGQTDSINGVGNLIVGYDEERISGSDKTGSHNMIIGPSNNYSSYGGLVAGSNNTISNRGASVSGGTLNTASGEFASVSGGEVNTASGKNASVSGGQANTASAAYASVSGGEVNTASGLRSSISGGVNNTASDGYASVSGGDGCEVAQFNGWGVGDTSLVTTGCVTTNTSP